MKENNRPSATPTNPSSFFTLVTGWMQQGVESFFSTQRILVDLAMRQNLSLMKTLRDDLSSPDRSPLVMLSELAAEGTATFLESQRVLIELAKSESELLMGGIKERVGGSAPALAMSEMVRRSLGTFLAMQEQFLDLANKQTTQWLHAVKAGKPYTGAGENMIDLAREAMENFVEAQKKFLDVIAEETMHATGEKHVKHAPMKKTELPKLAREAANAFLEAQKKLLDVAGQQMNTNLHIAGKAINMLRPLRLPLGALTGEGVKTFVEAEKALIDNMMKRGRPAAAPHSTAKRKPAHRARRPMATAAHAGA
ncbi:MAG: hypothetical protein ACRD3E_13425 [Terriglobales bacterium]